jgi:hypothetical protein
VSFLVNFNPHVPVLAADGAFLPDGRLVVSLRQACMNLIYVFVNFISQFNLMRSRADEQDDRNYAGDGA